MSRRNQAVVAAGFVVLGTLLGWSLVAGPPDPTAFKADDAIETLTVRLDVGTDGDALEEPVALDLGLGFPLWLHPIGRGEEPAPFGAVPQEASERWHVAAGSGATFTFRTTGDAGLDGLQVTPQLLAGVRVSDIARVGFASRGTNNWSIAGYEITVNGKPFASGKPTPNEADRAKLTELDGKVRQLTTEMKELRDLLKAGLATEADRNRLTAGETALKALAADKEKLTDPAPPNFKARDARDDARQKLAEILPALERLRADRADLADLVRARLATAEDRKRLDELTAQLRRLASDRARFEGQLDGRVAWFEDREFRSPWREAGPAVQSARVTLVTQTHTEADTQNFVYLRTGGRKYLLGSPTTPVTGTGGPQVFPLDLAAGPLTAADIRGWAVGMVGQPGRTGTAPDRWHPQRVVVEIDGRVVYDSESNDLDRRSLEAIRLIPPAHFDQAGTIVANSPVSREVFGWEAGKGAGLDPAGSALPLPPATDPTYPPVEPGAPGQPADMTVIVLPPDPMFPPLFPGEFLLPPDEFGLPGNW
ncbi:MAG TPA: hypothetical protein VM597_06290, partial [Gemmataceae bacterium]|nr:hypothetical protein [Gemmataceae bacterium]